MKQLEKAKVVLTKQFAASWDEINKQFNECPRFSIESFLSHFTDTKLIFSELPENIQREINRAMSFKSSTDQDMQEFEKIEFSIEVGKEPIELEIGLFNQSIVEALPLIAPRNVSLVILDIPYGILEEQWDNVSFLF